MSVSFVGGLGLAFPTHALLLLNGSTLGISGFMHRAVRGGKEEFLALTGLVLGGMAVGKLENAGPELFTSEPFPLILSGLLVGIGSKVLIFPKTYAINLPVSLRCRKAALLGIT